MENFVIVCFNQFKDNNKFVKHSMLPLRAYFKSFQNGPIGLKDMERIQHIVQISDQSVTHQLKIVNKCVKLFEKRLLITYQVGRKTGQMDRSSDICEKYNKTSLSSKRGIIMLAPLTSYPLSQVTPSHTILELPADI